MKKTIAVIYGGRSAEHEVSLVSGKSIVEKLNRERFEIREIIIEKNGDWLVAGNKIPVERALEEIDIAFPVLHGTYGEDGKIQGLFEMLNIPFVGCGVVESVLGMDKEFSKIIWRASDIPVVNFVAFKETSWQRNKADFLKKINQLELPWFVKPANLGSSVGITKVKSEADLENAVKFAFEYGEKVLVEESVKNAREIEVSLLGNKDVEVSICGEVVPANEFYDYNAKYENENSKLFIPAKLETNLMKEIQEAAKDAYKTLGLYGYARVDLLLNKETNKFFVSEANTIPGFTAISMFPKLWAESGLSYTELLTKLVDFGFEQYNEKSRYKI